MSFKSIKLGQGTYNRLERCRLNLETSTGQRKTFGDAVSWLLTLMEKMGELTGILEGSANFLKFQREKLEKQGQALGPGNS